MLKVLKIFVPVGLLMSLLSGCSAFGSQPTSWVSHSDSGVFYLKWTNSNGSINGVIYSTVPNHSNVDDPVLSENSSFTGQISHGNLTINENGSGTLAGTISNSKLALDFQAGSNLLAITFIPGQAKDYNEALSTFNTDIASIIARNQQRAVDEGFTNAIAQLPHLEGAVLSATAKVMSTSKNLNISVQNAVAFFKATFTQSCVTKQQDSRESDLYGLYMTASDDEYASYQELDRVTKTLSKNNSVFATESTTFSSSVQNKTTDEALVRGEKIERDALRLIKDADSSHQKAYFLIDGLNLKFIDDLKCR